ncbi:cell wall hydrolase [Novosphingobium sp. ZW T3_23]|uniref:cell wall hydrolase n=1 Tax=Novosphingobium sp. ZW T3_23 TaxID=3378084 RepID=UPI003852A5EA
MMRSAAVLLGAMMAWVPTDHAPGLGNNRLPRTVMAQDTADNGAIGPALARTINAAAPLAQGLVVAAQPFRFVASPDDRARAADCLAAAGYYEAGPEAADQRAVAQVVLNRVRHAAFPATVCGVVFAGSERATGCQFTFTCDGSLARRAPSAQDWRRARETAMEMLLGRVETGVGLATHYHTDWVTPSWDRAMDKLAMVNSHLFFRWRGAVGSPAAFVQRYMGEEPRIPVMSRLSTVHGGDAPGPKGALPMMLRENPAPPRLVPSTEVGVILATLPATSPEAFRDLAEKRCAGLEECRFIGWTDPSRKAGALPLPGASVDAISFTFVRRPGTPDRALWNCEEFGRSMSGQCLLRGS